MPSAQARAVRERLLREGEVVARSDAGVHSIFPVAIGAREGDVLQAWTGREGARRTIEVGLGYGVAALFICAAELSEPEIVLPRLLAERRMFDLAFVDGNHRFDGVFLDLVYLGRLVRRGGIVIVDDHQLPAIATAVSFCTTNLGWTVEETSTDDPQHHWAVLRTARSPDTRRFDHFVEF